MPMRKEAYPVDWPEIALRVKAAADWCCQDCGRQCRRPGEPFDTHKRTMSVHHIGIDGDPHNKMDVRPENLIALCAACHLRRDLPIHVQHAAETRRQKRIDSGQEVLDL